MRRHWLVTGGAGFIGSHLCDALVARGDQVTVLDDLSTGRRENVAHLLDHPAVRPRRGLDRSTRRSSTSSMGEVDGCLHLASAVGVQLVVDNPARVAAQQRPRHRHRALGRRPPRPPAAVHLDLRGLRQELDRRARRGRRTASSARPFKARWAYAIAKSFGESLAHSPAPRARRRRSSSCGCSTPSGRARRGRYGMVLPRFVRQALAGRGPDRLRQRHADALLRARPRHGERHRAAAGPRGRHRATCSTSAARRRSRSSSSRGG